MKSDWRYSKPVIGFDSNNLPIFLDSWNNKGVRMKWNSGQPFEYGQYLCAVIDCRKPVILSWHNDKKQWGEWTHGEYEDGMLEWEYFGNDRVEYYMRLDDIPMPEGF